MVYFRLVEDMTDSLKNQNEVRRQVWKSMCVLTEELEGTERPEGIQPSLLLWLITPKAEIQMA